MLCISHKRKEGDALETVWFLWKFLTLYCPAKKRKSRLTHLPNQNLSRRPERGPSFNTIIKEFNWLKLRSVYPVLFLGFVVFFLQNRSKFFLQELLWISTAHSLLAKSFYEIVVIFVFFSWKIHHYLSQKLLAALVLVSKREIFQAQYIIFK